MDICSNLDSKLHTVRHFADFYTLPLGILFFVLELNFLFYCFACRTLFIEKGKPGKNEEKKENDGEIRISNAN